MKCVRCPNSVVDSGLQICDMCRDSQSKKQAEIRRRKIANGLCQLCGLNPPEEGIQNCLTCKELLKSRYQARRDRLKDAAYAAYGGYVCSCCGESEPLFLSIDHVDGNGGEHRREMGRGRGHGMHLYAWLKQHAYPQGFQILCYNCNHGKHLNGNVCPHQKGSSSDSDCKQEKIQGCG